MNRFLKDESVEFETKHISATTLYYDKKTSEIIGFYTVAPSVLSLDYGNTAKDVIPPSKREGMTNFPAISIDYFAVDFEYQHQDVGKAMMLHLFKNLINATIKNGIGFTGVQIEALSGAVDFYENIGFDYLKDYEKKFRKKKSFDMFYSFNKMMEFTIPYWN